MTKPKTPEPKKPEPINPIKDCYMNLLDRFNVVNNQMKGRRRLELSGPEDESGYGMVDYAKDLKEIKDTFAILREITVLIAPQVAKEGE